MDIKQIKQAIRSVDLEGREKVPVRVADLVKLLNYVELIERNHRSMETALGKADEALESVLSQALQMPKSLDDYILDVKA